MPQLETFRDYLESHEDEPSFEQITSLNTSKFNRLADPELADLMSKGDRGAASEFWERYSKSVRGLLRRILGPNREVEPLVQAVFQNAYRNCADKEGKTSLGACTLVATIETVRSELRRKNRLFFLPKPGYSMVKNDPAEDLTDCSWTLFYLYEVYDKLDGDARLAFMLRHLEQMDLEDIAGVLGWSAARTAKIIEKTKVNVLSRAREIVTNHTTSTTQDNLIEKKDAKEKRDRAALRTITVLTRNSIDGESDSSCHFSGREQFLESIDREEMEAIGNVRSKKSVAVTLICLIVAAMVLISARVINGHWPFEKAHSYTELVENEMPSLDSAK